MSLFRSLRLRMNRLEVGAYLSGIKHYKSPALLVPNDIWFGNVEYLNRDILAPQPVCEWIERKSTGLASNIGISQTRMNTKETIWFQSSKQANRPVVAWNGRCMLFMIDIAFGKFSVELSNQTILCRSNSTWSLPGFEREWSRKQCQERPSCPSTCAVNVCLG